MSKSRKFLEARLYETCVPRVEILRERQLLLYTLGLSEFQDISIYLAKNQWKRS